MFDRRMNIRSNPVTAIAALSLTALTPVIAAAGTADGTITNLYQRSTDGLMVVNVSGAATGRPACATTQAYWIVKDENSSVGKGHFAMLLAALVAGKHVRVTGTNACTRWSDGEDIQYV